MPYSSWTKIDSGRESLWEPKVWLGALQIFARHEGEDYYDPAAPMYADLDSELPGQGWMKQDTNGSPRPLFRDYPKPWTSTGVLEIANRAFKLTDLGKQVVTGRLSTFELFQGFVKRWTEDGERPFSEIALAILNANEPLSLRDLYFGVMLGFRKGDDVRASIQNARTVTADMDDLSERRLNLLLSIFEAVGAIAKEDSKQKNNAAKWIPWNRAFLQEVADTSGAVSGSTFATNAGELKDIVGKFFADTQSAALSYDRALIERFLAATLTKRFCILTGLAGSGKTKLAEAFALWLCESPNQYRIVAVGADWTSNENLLGYADALQPGRYRAPVNGALELVIRAQADKDNPYFLILDEMNLSHVERYFADFLSAMESDNAPLALHGATTDLALDEAGAILVPAKLPLPANLFIIGTVNVDETTYMFSPKVLDRANVIEFRATATQMGLLLENQVSVELKALNGLGVTFSAAYVQRTVAVTDISTLTDDAGKPLRPQLKDDLLAVFSTLAQIGAEFGFRTAKEIARFMVIQKELAGASWDYKAALDAQVLQKLLPKLHGSARKLSGVLKVLQEFATAHSLPLTLEKITRMQQRLDRDGFTSFAEA
jgi:MoxR-like ATPase